MKFYKGVLVTDLKSGYMQGTVTTIKSEDVVWMERIQSKKRHGAAKHIRHGKSCLIEIEFPESELKDSSFFKRQVFMSMLKKIAGLLLT